MNNRECEEIFDFLVEELVRADLGWIVEQVNASISFGKQIEAIVKESKKGRSVTYELISSNETIPANEISSNLKYVQKVVEYSEREKLGTLLDAIEVALVSVGEIEKSTIDTLSKSATDTLSSKQSQITVTFVPDRDNINQIANVKLSNQSSNQLATSRDELREKVNILRAEVNANQPS